MAIRNMCLALRNNITELRWPYRRYTRYVPAAEHCSVNTRNASSEKDQTNLFSIQITDPQERTNFRKKEINNFNKIFLINIVVFQVTTSRGLIGGY
jgi:flagellar biosynthesis regulator FlaF